MAEIKPYGSWQSPISAERAAEASGGPQWTDFVDGEVWWAEARAIEGGRVTVLRATEGGEPEELLPAPWNARNRVHEYGGRPWTQVDGVLVFTNWDDQRVYARSRDGEIGPLTPEPADRHGVRYSDLRPGLPGEVWAVRERAIGPAPTDIARDHVAIPLDGGDVRVLSAGHHFLTTPQLSPDGARAAWLGWEHPAMPWDGTELCVAEVLGDGTLGSAKVVAGGERVAVCQVEWESERTLLALADPDGWWNLHRIDLDGHTENLAPIEAELGGPMWQLGGRWFAPLGDGRFAILHSGRLAVLDEHQRTVTGVAGAADLLVWGASLAVHDGTVLGVAAGPRYKAAVVTVDLAAGEVRAVTSQPENLPDPAYLPVPEDRVFIGADGQRVHAFVYPPTNPEFAAPEGERPPYLVHVHGGPTSAFAPALNLALAFFTSRGIGIVAVNYGGSTGYGRQFRERLRTQWGIEDVADCAAVAEALADTGAADPERLAVRGGSAGGFTSARSATSVHTYRAATIMFPVIDLLTFAGGETHDFESRYLDGLIGPLPETRDRYIERSPSTHVDALGCPVLLLQGLEDEICPPAQAERFVGALNGKGIPHAYVTFEGEQHGFRRAESIAAALNAEMSFYGQVFGFDTPGVPPLELST